jgi:hypothetical protein
VPACVPACLRQNRVLRHRTPPGGCLMCPPFTQRTNFHATPFVLQATARRPSTGTAAACTSCLQWCWVAWWAPPPT